MSILLAIFFPLLTSLADSSQWAEVLKDAQETNRSMLRSGSADVDVLLEPAPNPDAGHTVTVQGRVSWSEDRMYVKYRFRSPSVGPFYRKSELALDKAPWNYYITTKTQSILFNPESSILSVTLRRDDLITSLVHLHPEDNWFSCCPGRHGSGRLWSEMLTFKIREKDGRESTNTFRQVSPDEIEQVRADPDGYRLTIVYSLSQGGNVVRFAGTPPNPNGMTSRGTYVWRKLGSAYILDTCEAFSNFTGKAGDGMHYQLKVSNVSLQTPPASLFELDALRKELIGSRILVRDKIAKKEYVIKGKSELADEGLRPLTGVLQNRGFAKPK